MKKLSLYVMMAVFGVMLTVSSVAAQDANEVMQKSHISYYYAANDGLAEVSMVLVDKKGKERTREFTMLRLDAEDGGNQKYYTYFKKPSDVARLTFMVHKQADGNDARWIYVPAVDLVKPISADDKNSSFVGSDFTYEDVSGRHWNEDAHTFVREDQLDGNGVYVIESAPKDAGYDGFAKKISYIDKEAYLPLKEEYFNGKGELIRLFTADKVDIVEEIPTVTVRTMENVKKGTKTTVTFSSIDYNVGVEDDTFTERYLKSPPRTYIK